MDLEKMGGFLRDLRKEKNLTQEQLAEKFFVSSRSISRWERGSNMPDIEVLMSLADFYEVDLVEILNGQRRSEMTAERETNLKVSEYEKEQKRIFAKAVRIFLIVSFVGSVLAYFLTKLTPSLTGGTLDAVKFTIGFFQGFTMGTLLLGILYSYGFFKSHEFLKFTKKFEK